MHGGVILFRGTGADARRHVEADRSRADDYYLSEEATVALVGDRAQLAAVGRGGVLDIAAQIRGRTFDMTEVHRFTDPAYADLTLRMRNGNDPGSVFDKLATLGLVRVHASEDDVREHIATQPRNDAAVTVSTNDEARAMNARIRAERVNSGEADDVRTVFGSDGLPIGTGDVIQTRKNNTNIGVANRQNWIVQHVDDDGTLHVREAGNGRKRQRTVRLPAEYVAEYAHLSYAATAYGVQGATVDTSHTLLTDATSAAGVYAGMTRGRSENVLHIVAAVTEARTQFIDAMERDRADRGLADATQRATEDVRGLVKDGPARFVNEEIAALAAKAQDAEMHAETDGHAYAEATATKTDADERLRSASKFGTPKARRGQRAASERAEQVRARLRERWGSTPEWHQTIDAWVSSVTDHATERTPEVTQAAEALTNVESATRAASERHRTERRTLLGKLYGAERVRRDPLRYELARPEREAQQWARTAQGVRAEITGLQALPPEQAASRIRQQRAEAAAARTAQEQALAARAERMREGFAQREAERRRSGPERGGPSLGL